MDYLDLLEDEPEGPEQTWEVRLLDGDPATGAPEVKWEVTFCDAETIERATRPYRPRRTPFSVFSQDEYSPQQRKDLRTHILPMAVRGWSGMTWINFQRMSPWAARRPQLGDKFADDSGTPTEITFNKRNFEFVCSHMEHGYYNVIINSAISPEEATLEARAKKKGLSNSSAGSSQIDLPLNDVSASMRS